MATLVTISPFPFKICKKFQNSAFTFPFLCHKNCAISRAANCYEKILVTMILDSYYDATKIDPNSMIFLKNDLYIFFKSVHQNSYKLQACFPLSFCKIHSILRYPMEMTKIP